MLQCPKCRFPEKVPSPQDQLPVIEMEPVDDSDKQNTPSQITSFEAKSQLETTVHYQRPLGKTGQGATRLRTFHTRLSEKAMNYLDLQINEWIDQNPDIEVKFSNITVGIVEGKKAEEHLIVNVWY